jgi:uncharacterized Zn-binding protein involved in type VI secretion
MGAPAARLTDTVEGKDTHVVDVPSATGSVPTPLPGHIFSGTLTSGASSDVRIDGLPAAVVGTVATNFPEHSPMPPGISFTKPPPSNRGTVSHGSSSVRINGSAAARLDDLVRTCNYPADADTSAITSGSGTVTIG